MFEKNMRLLKGSFPNIWQKVIEMEKDLDKNMVRSFSPKDGYPNLKFGKQYIHDKKDPLQEAKNIITNQRSVAEHSDILFYGVGLGYHIHAFVEQYPNLSFTIYEPVPEVFYQFLKHSDLEKIPRQSLKNFIIETKPEDQISFCNSFINSIRSSVLVIDFPAYQSLFPEKRQAFFSQFENCISERRNSLATVSAFEKRWTINSIKNFPQVLNSPNILLENTGMMKNKPALLVASGPSLLEEIENLRDIKQKGLAYIFSVGTALNALVQHGIYPDAACTYDPTEKNQIVCKEVLEKGIHSIPLIFGSTVGYETVEKYPGPKSHMLINQDTVAAFYCKPKEKDELEFIIDAPTIAVITLQLLFKLGFNPIILVGQNLAYRDSSYYAAGSTYHPTEASEQDLANAIPINDVYGNEIASNTTFIRMRQQMEIYLRHYQDCEVINTTQYGAHIEGTRFQALDHVITERLHDRVVEGQWLKPSQSSYDMEYLIERCGIMETSFSKTKPLLEKCKHNLTIIGELKECGDYVKIGQSYDQFNYSMDALRNNQFFATFITPMNRVSLKSLMLVVPSISAETDPILKAQMMEKEFLGYLNTCEQDIIAIGLLFQEMSHSIQQVYQSYTVRKKSTQTKILLIDCDGILSDGAIYYAASGDELKKFNFKDRVGIRLLKEKGINMLLINPNNSPLINNAASKFEISTVSSSTEDVTEILTNVLKTYKIDDSELACLFNDLTDLQAFKHVGLKFAVRNSSKEMQQEVDYILPVDGGEGVMLALAELLTGKKPD